MKKKLFSLLTALVLCLLCAVPAFAEMPLVMDTYELFKPEATAELEQKAQDASAGHGVNVYLLTVSDIGGQNVREFAKDWYRDYDLGYGEGKSGILFLIALDSRDYVTITYGGGVTAFTDYRIAQIEDKIVPMLSDGTYYKASETYIEMCADTLDFYAEKGAPLDSGNDPAKGWIKWVFVFVIPLAVASIIVLVAIIITIIVAPMIVPYGYEEILSVNGKRDKGAKIKPRVRVLDGKIRLLSNDLINEGLVLHLEDAPKAGAEK